MGNDSTRWLRVAPEVSFAQQPTWLITVGGTGGTFNFTIDNLTGTAPYNQSLANLQSQIDTVLGPGKCIVGGSIGAWTIKFLDDGQDHIFSCNFAAITGGGTNALTGGPQWILLKISKGKHDPNLNVSLDKEVRNSPDMTYEDSLSVGGQSESWEFDGGIRADQFGHVLAMAGYSDSVVTVSGVSTHTMKPGMAPNNGKSYSAQFYDGQTCYQSRGLTATELKLVSKGGEKGSDAFSFKGWGTKGAKLYSIPSITLPSNTSYRKTKPTNSGRAIAFAGGASNSLLSDFEFTWKRGAEPFYTQTGTVHPYRPSFGERTMSIKAKLLYDDPTEMDQARTANPSARSLAVTMPHTEIVSGSTVASVAINAPQLFWLKPVIDAGGDSTILNLDGQTVFNTAASAQAVFTIVNADTQAYA